MDDKKDQDSAPGIRMKQLAHGKPVYWHQEKRKVKPQQLKS